MRRPWILAGLPAVVLAQEPTTWYRAFRDGQEAFERGQWREASKSLLVAVRMKPKSEAMAMTYGNNFLPGYYPWSMLAKCAIELGQLEDAEDYLKEATRRGEPKDRVDGLRQELQRRKPAPPAKKPDPAPAETKPAFVPETRRVEPIIPAPAQPQTPEVSNKPLPDPPPRDPLPSTRRQVPPRSETPRAQPTQPPAVSSAAPTPAVRTIPASPSRPWIWGLGSGIGVGALVFFLGRLKRPVRKPNPNTRSALPADLHFGDFCVESRLGSGGFGTTYLARPLVGGDPVVLKVLAPHRAMDPQVVQRFQQEAELGMKLDHPGLVRVLAFSTEDEQPWLAMEFAEGETLDAVMLQRKPLPLPEVLSIARSIAEALAYAHTFGVVHRDLKPSNVVVGPAGVKLLDFGIARVMSDEGLTTTGAFMGTPMYAAPEAWMGHRVGPAMDRYTLGIMLFELVAGRPPFQGDTPFALLEQHRTAFLPAIEEFRKGVPPALSQLVRRLCHKDPVQRPEDGEILRVLQDLEAKLKGA